MTRRAKADPEDEPLRARFRVALGRRIRAARLRSGLSQDELAAAAGITKGYVFEIESRGANLSYEAILVIARALRVGLRDLMPDTEHDRPAALLLADLAAAAGRLSDRLDALGRAWDEAAGLRDEMEALMRQARQAFPPEEAEGGGEA